MEVIYAQRSIPGPVRTNNEDCVGFWQPETLDLKRGLGIVAVLADGVGGESHGEIASQLAVNSILKAFKEAGPETAQAKLIRQMFNEASRAVYDASMQNRDLGRMATTLTVSVFRNNEVSIGHVGDTRAYLVRKGEVKRITTDHSYGGLRAKLGLISEHDAMTSPYRSVLTRSLGLDPICHFDYLKQVLLKGDIVVQCSDGLYGFVVDAEIGDIASHYSPEEACQRLIALAERRQGDDNISVQVIQVNRVERPSFYRGSPFYQKTADVPASNEIEIGQVLDNRFEITELVSRSGMASIFKANDRKTNQTVALKVPLMQFESDAASFSRFEREEEIGKTLNHPYVLKVIPVEDLKSRPYIAMEYLEGQTLGELLHSLRPLPETDAAKIGSRVCEALEHMHQRNVVHRDLKPQNIMICNDGSIRIMDFGIAKASQLRRITFVGFSPTMGTPDYMAPEQVRGKRGDERTDIYSLGAILYEMATGSVPFEGESPYVIMNARLTGDPLAPRKVNPKITPVLEEIILHALERNPTDRYPSAAAMKAELDDYEKVPLIGRCQHLRAPQPWKNRFRMAPLIAIFVVAQILVFLFLYWFFRRPGLR